MFTLYIIIFWFLYFPKKNLFYITLALMCAAYSCQLLIKFVKKSLFATSIVVPIQHLMWREVREIIIMKHYTSGTEI